ncbi:hypothetical protein HRI_004600300 [Hibiscus trionum]|uniref:CCHC-type domain-containing protein n=1 Tax=Hibiscus trionum TaxID=183268 RepID=A0A9W7MU30_HIBTR|nr:hypothetical protein HRI_004600300 [Hibiscus trionum]
MSNAPTPAPDNPRKHRRIDDDPPDRGRPAPVTTVNAAVNPPPPGFSYKEALMHKTPHIPDETEEIIDEEEIEIEEGDVTRSEVDSMISIDFSDRVISLAEKSFEQTLVVKLLGRRIGYNTLRNKIYEIWKPSQPVKLMDVENDYFLVSFRTKADYQNALTKGPWTVFGHYLTVQPWMPLFSTSTPYPSSVMAWIRLPGLPVIMYKKNLIAEIGESIGEVIRIDYQTEHGRRGRFARMAVYVDLSKPLVSKLLINGNVQIVEYESLPTICFNCGKYGHLEIKCPDAKPVPESETNNEAPVDGDQRKKDDSFGPWMVVERKNRKPQGKQSEAQTKPTGMVFQGSRFNPIFESDIAESSSPHSHDSTLLDVPIQQARSAASLPRSKLKQKGKVPIASASRPLSLRKPPVISLSDFPVLARHTGKSNASRLPPRPLDLSKHTAIVVDENANPNIPTSSVPSPHVPAPVPTKPTGDPPDPQNPTVDGAVSPSSPPTNLVSMQANAGQEATHDPGSSQAVAMLE